MDQLGSDITAEGNDSTGVIFEQPRSNANDFNFFNASVQDANRLELSLLYLQNSSLASGVIDQAQGHDIYFDHTNLYADEARADGSGVVWNPDVALGLTNGDYMSAALNLLSELAHMTLPGGLGDNQTVDILWDSPAEAIAHMFANDVAAQLGEPERLAYSDGTPFNIGDPTDSFNSLTDGMFNELISIDLGSLYSELGSDSSWGSTSDMGGGSAWSGFADFGDWGAGSSAGGSAWSGFADFGGGGGGGGGGFDWGGFSDNAFFADNYTDGGFYY